MNIIQFWIVDTIVKVSPTYTNLPINNNNNTINRENLSDHTENQNENDERSPLLPK
jgi:hypothetical protein